MTIFEFLSVAVSIVLALTLGKLIAATPHVFSSGARDVLHAGFFLVNSFVVLVIWWMVWTLNDKASWNFLEFITLMGSPICLYLSAHILVSDEPREIDNWRVHFESVHRWYFAATLATVVFAILRMTLVLGAQMRLTLGFIALVIAFTVGIVSSRRSIHAGVLLFWLLFQVFAVSQQFTSN